MPKNYDTPSGDPNLGDDSSQDLAALSQHIGEWWGEGVVFHEIVSEYVHVDVHTCPPTAERPYHVLVTTGMSDRAMAAPEGFAQHRHCELMLALPPTWPMDQDSFQEERNWWPLRHLKQTARFPHVYETWLWYSHTVGNGNDLTPVAPGVPFVGFALSIPTLCPDGARKSRIREGKEVHFFALIPLHEAEIKFAWEHGTAALFEKLDDAGVNELVDVTRPCVITGRSVATDAPARATFTEQIKRWFGKR